MLNTMNRMNKAGGNQIFKFSRESNFRLANLLPVIFLIITLVYFTSESAAQSTPAKSLLALSKKDHIMAIVDPVT